MNNQNKGEAMEAKNEDYQNAVAWMIWLHGPAGVFENKDEALLELERRNKLYPNDAKDRKLLELRAALASAQEEIAGLLKVAEIHKCQRDMLLGFVQSAPVASGVCCCGDDMERHGNPMDCGHSPVDMWDHAVIGWVEEFKRADKAQP